jgi:hypothetical protein
MSTVTSPLLRLPLELRREIYSHLVFPTFTCMRFHNMPAVVSTHTLNPSLAYVCSQLNAEFLAYYDDINLFMIKIVASLHWFPRTNIIQDHPIYRRMRRLRIAVHIDETFLSQYPSFGVEGMGELMRGTCRTVCRSIAQAPALRELVLDLQVQLRMGEMVEEAQIEWMKRIVQPFEMLKHVDRIWRCRGEGHMREDTRVEGLLWNALEGILSAKIAPSTRVMPAASTTKFRQRF